MLGYDPEVSQSHLRANAKTGSQVWASDIYRKVTLVSVWDEQRRGNSERSPVISQVSSSPSLDLFTHSHSSSFSLNLWMSCWVETVVLFPVTSECDWWDGQTQRDLQGALQTCSQETGCSEKNSGHMFFSVWLKLQVSVCVCSVFLTQRKIHAALKVCRQWIRKKTAGET